MLDFLEKEEAVSPALLREVEAFREANPLAEGLRARIPAPRYHYYGREIWEQAIAALLCGKNLLLTGGKATGKNVLAENLAAAFGRPAWNVSFHVNMDAASLIGMDTFEGGEVRFRPGPIYQCARYGGFGILDEINMAKNEALAVLHAALDFRRAIDVPGYERVAMAEPTRFIATMNYGYAGTRELNEALTSRFVVIQMPTISPENLDRPRPVRPAVFRAAKEMRERGDLHQGPGPAGPAGRPRLDAQGRAGGRGAGYGHHQQGVRQLRTGADPGCDRGPHPGPACRRRPL